MNGQSRRMAGEKCDALIVGGGPAGLRAAELLSAQGLRTVLADRMPSVGRKFLVAGRGGLNLTHSEPMENFPARYGTATDRWQKLIADFSPADLRAWVERLGIETFVGTSGRVFPVNKQAAPLLRRWIERLRGQGVSFRPRHHFSAFRSLKKNGWEVTFTTKEGPVLFQTRSLILATGGASWPQTGSDGTWTQPLTQAGIEVAPLAPANCGYAIDWPPEFLAEAEGLPLKNIVAHVEDQSVAGELLITNYGVEGGAIYQLGRALRAMAHPAMEVDLKPAFTRDELIARIRHAKSPHLLDQASRAWRLSPASIELLKLRGPYATASDLACMTKAYSLVFSGPRPLAEAISSAGGVKWSELDDNLMLVRSPGIFCAGEMIDWDAPTGGYLIQGCFSTATRAAHGVVQFLNQTC